MEALVFKSSTFNNPATYLLIQLCYKLHEKGSKVLYWRLISKRETFAVIHLYSTPSIRSMTLFRR